VPAEKNPRINELFLLLAVFALSLIIRLRDFNFLAHYFFISDEWLSVINGLNIAQGEWKPLFYKYGSLPQFVYGALYSVYFFLASTADSSVGALSDHIQHFPLSGDNFILFSIGRSVSLAFGLGTVLLLSLITRKMFGIRAGIICAVLVSLSPLHIFHSQIMKIDIIYLFFLLLVILGSLAFSGPTPLRSYVFTGIAAGLAISTRYNYFVLVPLGASHIYLNVRTRERGKTLSNYRLIFSLGAAGLTFIITCPFLVTDTTNFVFHLKEELSSAQQFLTHSGTPRIFFQSLHSFIVQPFLTCGPFIYLTGVAGFFFMFTHHRYYAFVLFSYLLCYHSFLSLLSQASAMPFAYLPSGMLLIVATASLISRLLVHPGTLRRTAGRAILFLSIIFFVLDLHSPQIKYQTAWLDQTGQWLSRNVKGGSEVLSSLELFNEVELSKTGAGGTIMNWLGYDELKLSLLSTTDPISRVRIHSPEYIVLLRGYEAELSRYHRVRFAPRYLTFSEELKGGTFPNYSLMESFSGPPRFPGWISMFLPAETGRAAKEIAVYRREKPVSQKDRIQYLDKLFARDELYVLSGLPESLAGLAEPERELFLGRVIEQCRKKIDSSREQKKSSVVSALKAHTVRQRYESVWQKSQDYLLHRSRPPTVDFKYTLAAAREWAR